MEKRTKSLLGAALLGLGTVLCGQTLASTGTHASAVRVSGLLQTDAAMFSGDTKTGFDDSAWIRRAELAFKGNLPNHWSYQVGFDLQKSTRLSTESLENSWLGYNGFKPLFVAIGRVSIPQGLSHWGSAATTTFMERSMVAKSLAPNDGLGVYGEYIQGDFTLAGAIIKPDAHDNNAGLGDDPVTWGLRATFSPMHTAGNVLHFGTSYWRQEFKNGTGGGLGNITAGPEVSVRATPNTIASLTRGDGATSYTTDWGLEAAGVWGSLSAQAEYQNFTVHGRRGNKDLQLPGYYVQVSYFLTGESRSYDQASGTFGGVKPACATCGAWEIAMRYSDLDLSDRANNATEAGNLLALTDASGDSNGQPGESRNWTVGVNWYANSNVRFQLNYINADVDYARAARNLGRKNRDMNIVGLRAQVRF